MENSKQQLDKNNALNEPVEGQDFAEEEQDDKVSSSHGEAANQKGSDFSELEESRMEHPPEKREANGSSKNDVDCLILEKNRRMELKQIPGK